MLYAGCTFQGFYMPSSSTIHKFSRFLLQFRPYLDLSGLFQYSKLSEQNKKIFDNIYPAITRRDYFSNKLFSVSDLGFNLFGFSFVVIESTSLLGFFSFGLLVTQVALGALFACLAISALTSIFRYFAVHRPRSLLLRESGTNQALNLLSDASHKSEDLRGRLRVLYDRFEEFKSTHSQDCIPGSDLDIVFECSKFYLSDAQRLLSENSVDLISQAILRSADEILRTPSSKQYSFFQRVTGVKAQHEEKRQALREWFNSDKFKDGFYDLTGFDLRGQKEISLEDLNGVFDLLQRRLILSVTEIENSLNNLEDLFQDIDVAIPEKQQLSWLSKDIKYKMECYRKQREEYRSHKVTMKIPDYVDKLKMPVKIRTLKNVDMAARTIQKHFRPQRKQTN